MGLETQTLSVTRGTKDQYRQHDGSVSGDTGSEVYSAEPE